MQAINGKAGSRMCINTESFAFKYKYSFVFCFYYKFYKLSGKLIPISAAPAPCGTLTMQQNEQLGLPTPPPITPQLTLYITVTSPEFTCTFS